MTHDTSFHHEPSRINDPVNQLIAEITQRLMDGHSVSLCASAESQVRIIPEIVRQLHMRGAYVTRVDVSGPIAWTSSPVR